MCRCSSPLLTNTPVTSNCFRSPTGVAIRDVSGVVLRSFQVRKEQHLQAIGGGDLLEIFLGIIGLQVHQMEVRIPCNQAGLFRMKDRRQRQRDFLGRLLGQVDLAARAIRFQPGDGLDSQLGTRQAHGVAAAGNDLPAEPVCFLVQPTHSVIEATQDKGLGLEDLEHTDDPRDRLAGPGIEQFQFN